MALLRLAIGLTQKEMADLLDCSPPTIQSIELGRLAISQKLAQRAALQTGATIAWLLENDTSKPPVDYQGKPITMEGYTATQAQLKRSQNTDNEVDRIGEAYAVAVVRIFYILHAALDRGNADLTIYKLLQPIDRLTKEMGMKIHQHPTMETILYDVTRKPIDDTKNLNAGLVNALTESFYDLCEQKKRHEKTDVKKPSRASAKRSPGRKA